MSDKIVEARFCAENCALVLIYKMDKREKFKQHGVIDLADAQDVVKSLGFQGEIHITDEQGLYRSTGS